MTPRNRALLIVGLVVLLLLVLIFGALSLFRGAAPAAPTDQQVPAPTDIPDPEIPVETFENPLITETPVAQGSTAALQMAELFAERYGSYSNQGDYQNLRDLLAVMTADYRSRTEAFLETVSPTPGATYEGVTSVKISSEVRSSDESSAVVAVSLQQTRRVGAETPTIGYRSLRMELELVGDEWRVDSAAWED